MGLQQTTIPSVEPVSLLEAKNWVRADSDLTQDDALLGVVVAAARRFAEAQCRRSIIAQGWRYTADAFPLPQYAGVRFGSTYSLPPNAFQLERGDVLQVQQLQYLDMNAVWQTLAPSVYTADFSSNPARVTPVFGQIWPPTLPQIAAVRLDYTAGYATACAFNAGTDTFTPALWPPLAVNDPVVFSLSGDSTSLLAAPLLPNTTYYVQSVVSPGVYKVAATVGGAAIDITATTTAGAIAYLGQVPEGLRNWMQIRLGTLYTNREEVAMLARGKIELLPYVDVLLDPMRIEIA